MDNPTGLLALDFDGQVPIPMRVACDYVCANLRGQLQRLSNWSGGWVWGADPCFHDFYVWQTRAGSYPQTAYI